MRWMRYAAGRGPEGEVGLASKNRDWCGRIQRVRIDAFSHALLTLHVPQLMGLPSYRGPFALLMLAA